MRTAKTLIRLGGCPGWSESSLGAQLLCWFCNEVAQMTPCAIVLWLMHLSCSTTKQTNDICAQISLGRCPVWTESLLFAQRKYRSLATHKAHIEDWSDWADAKCDLRLRWAHMFVCFVMLWLICAVSHAKALTGTILKSTTEYILDLKVSYFYLKWNNVLQIFSQENKISNEIMHWQPLGFLFLWKRRKEPEKGNISFNSTMAISEIYIKFISTILKERKQGKG